MPINFQEPRCRSAILYLRAEHCLKRANMLEEIGKDMGEWVDLPIAGSVAHAMPGLGLALPAACGRAGPIRSHGAAHPSRTGTGRGEGSGAAGVLP